MKTTKILFLLVLMISCFVGCSDDNDDEINGIDVDSMKKLLLSNPWKLEQQLINGIALKNAASEDEPYVLNFTSETELKTANFNSTETQTWSITDGKLVIDDDEKLTIKNISTSNLILSFTADGVSKELHFVKDEPIEAFPEYVLERTYQFAEVFVNDEVVTNKNQSFFRTKVLLEKESITGTMLWYRHISWEVISGSFISLNGNYLGLLQEGENYAAGYSFKLEENGNIRVQSFLFDDENEETSTKIDVTLKECKVWDFLSGPDWTLKEVLRGGKTITENLPIPLGSIWYFNSVTQMVEERTSSSDKEIDYMPWSFSETPNDENVKVDINVENDEVQTFTLLKGNILELELETIIDSETYVFSFVVKAEKDMQL